MKKYRVEYYYGLFFESKEQETPFKIVEVDCEDGKKDGAEDGFKNGLLVGIFIGGALAIMIDTFLR